MAAGSPTLASENIEKTVNCPANFFGSNFDYFLRVKGLSMKDAGIMEDDLIAVKKTQDIKNGDIVIDEYSFPKCNWCRMVPKIIELFNDIFESIYTSSGWNAMVDLKNEIYVDIITERDGTDRDDVLHYNFYVNLNGKVIQEVFEEGKAEQLWKKGKPMAYDYFTLESHSEVPKVITAISEIDLEIKGNITLT